MNATIETTHTTRRAALLSYISACLFLFEGVAVGEYEELAEDEDAVE